MVKPPLQRYQSTTSAAAGFGEGEGGLALQAGGVCTLGQGFCRTNSGAGQGILLCNCVLVHQYRQHHAACMAMRLTTSVDGVLC